MRQPVVIVIEAPGKISSYRKVFSHSNVRIIATGGHFCRRENDSLSDLGISAGWQETGRLPEQYVVAQLTDKLSGATELIIATDPDQEGDVIARDIAAVARGVATADLIITRMRPFGLAAGCLHTAAINRETWTDAHDRAAFAGDARRILDRLMGAAALSWGAGGLGRVSTRLIASISARPLLPFRGTVVLPATDGRSPFIAHVDTKDEAQFHKITALAKTVPVCGVAPHAITARIKPYCYGEAVNAVSQRLEVETSEAAMLIQQAYEDGLLSYPRSSNRSLEPDALTFLRRLAKHHALPWNPERNLSVHGPSHTGHPAPAPIGAGAGLSLTRPLNVMPRTHAAVVIIARRLVECCSDFQQGISQDFPAELAGLHFTRPVIPLPWVHVPKESSGKLRKREVVLIERMVENNIGRPSTQVGHAHKAVANDKIEVDYQVSEQSSIALNRLPLSWREAGLSDAIDNLVTPDNADSPAELVEALLMLAGPETRNKAIELVAGTPALSPVTEQLSRNIHNFRQSTVDRRIND